MVNVKTIGAYASIPLLAAVLILAGMNVQPDATHQCDSTKKQAYCFALSGGKSTLCYQNPAKTKSVRCVEGWKLKAPVPETITPACNPTVLAYNNNCDTGVLYTILLTSRLVL